MGSPHNASLAVARDTEGSCSVSEDLHRFYEDTQLCDLIEVLALPTGVAIKAAKTAGWEDMEMSSGHPSAFLSLQEIVSVTELI